jgi:hypothetical protein
MLHLETHAFPDALLHPEMHVFPDACINLIGAHPIRFTTPPTVSCLPCDDGVSRRGGGVAPAGRGMKNSWMAVGLKLAEEGLILLFLRCDTTLHKPVIA